MIAELVNPGGGGGLPKFKQGPPSPLELNPISQHYEIGRLVGSAGPELVWKIYDAKRKSDNKVSVVSVLVTITDFCKLRKIVLLVGFFL